MIVAGIEDPAFKLEPDGHFSCGPIIMAPGFIFTEEGCQRAQQRYGTYAPIELATYIHEYDHFVLMALQRVPMVYAALLLCTAVVKPHKFPPSPEDVNELIRKYEGALSEKRLAAAFFVWGIRIHQVYEDFGAYLDTFVFDELGYKTPPGHFNPLPRMLVPFSVPSAQAVFHVLLGCPLLEVPPEKRIETLAHWETTLSMPEGPQANFAESLFATDIRNMTLGKLLEIEEKEEGAPTSAQE
jgi:hypothetical protein